MRTFRAAVVAFLVFAIVGPAAATDPPPPSVTVSPMPMGAGVEHHIDASFTETGSTYLIAVCLAGTDFSDIIAAAGRCSIEEQGGATGTSVDTTIRFFSSSFQPVFGGTRFDCRDVACELAAAIGDGSITVGGKINQVIVTPISFHLEVRGAGTAFRPGDDETVGTTVWGPHTRVEVVQCQFTQPSRGCNVGDEIPAGEEVGGVVMRRFLDHDGETIDCAIVTCGSGVRIHGIPGATGPVDYLRPAVLLAPRINGGRWITEVPVDGAFIAEGLPENTWGASSWQCVESEIADPFDPTTACGVTDAFVSPGYDTDYDSAITVVRHLDVGGTVFDCKFVDCVIALSGWTSPAMSERTETHTVGLTYAPMVRNAGDFINSSGDRIGANIRFFVDSFYPPGGEWSYAQCIGEPTIETQGDLCEAPAPLPPPTSGNRTVVVTPAKSVITTATGDHRCFQRGCTAMVVYTPPGDAPDYLLRPIHLRVQTFQTPTRDLVDGQTVHIEEIGVVPTAPGAGAFVMQCGGYHDGERSRIGCGNAGTSTTDHGGHFVGSIDAQATFAAGAFTVDCRVHACAFAVVSIGPGPELLGGTLFPVRFADPPP